jgi:hypothetical protein
MSAPPEEVCSPMEQIKFPANTGQNDSAAGSDVTIHTESYYVPVLRYYFVPIYGRSRFVSIITCTASHTFSRPLRDASKVRIIK